MYKNANSWWCYERRMYKSDKEDKVYDGGERGRREGELDGGQGMPVNSWWCADLYLPYGTFVGCVCTKRGKVK